MYINNPYSYPNPSPNPKPNSKSKLISRACVEHEIITEIPMMT